MTKIRVESEVDDVSIRFLCNFTQNNRKASRFRYLQIKIPYQRAKPEEKTNFLMVYCRLTIKGDSRLLLQH